MLWQRREGWIRDTFRGITHGLEWVGRGPGKEKNREDSQVSGLSSWVYLGAICEDEEESKGGIDFRGEEEFNFEHERLEASSC